MSTFLWKTYYELSGTNERQEIAVKYLKFNNHNMHHTRTSDNQKSETLNNALQKCFTYCVS